MAVSKEEVEVVVNDDGTVEMKVVKSAGGKSCLELTKTFEDALGGVTDRTLTGDYHKKPVRRIKQKGGG